MHSGRRDGCILLERTGPSIAPITFPGAGDLVVTQAFRGAIEGAGLTGFTFLPVIKHHIVQLEWENWDMTAGKPAKFPKSGEPEDYILSGEHSPETSDLRPQTSDQIGLLWELVLHVGLEVERSGTSVRLLPETWDGTDMFTARTTRINCVSQKARVWLERHFADYVTFRPLN